MTLKQLEYRDVTLSSDEAIKNLNDGLCEVRRRLLLPPKKESLSEWADANRFIGLGSAEAGPWRTSRAPYQREPLDVCGEYGTQRVVLMWAAQTGKTSILENVIAHSMAADPSPILVVQPNESMAMSFAENKIDPMIESMPVLQNLVASKSKRDGGNRRTQKAFTGGFLAIVSAKSPSSLRSRSVRVLLLDEIDAFDATVGQEGDPIKIAEVRTTTFPNRKIILTSTPTIKGFSRIEREYLQSDQRRFFVPCPLCGEYQTLEWGGMASTYGIKWDNSDETTVRYRCSECQGEFTENHKLQMMLKGEWRTTNPDGKFPGFAVSSLYSPWVSWSDLVKEWHEVQGLPDKQQEFFNLRMGEPWEDRSNKLEIHELANHIHDFNAPCPTRGDGCNGVAVITCGVDIQENWIEAAVWGIGAGEEMWLLDTPQFHGDTTTDAPWLELQSFLKTTYNTLGGVPVPISITAIDSGNQTEIVYRKVNEFTKAGIRCVAIKGFDGARAVFEWSRYKNTGKPRLGLVGVSQAKGILMARLKNVGVFGPGYIHFPAGVLPDVLEQITSEQKITVYGKGNVPTTVWKKLRARNEQLDCLVYAYAALHSYKDILNQLDTLAEKHKLAQGVVPTTTTTKPVKPKPRRISITPRLGGFGGGFSSNPWR